MKINMKIERPSQSEIFSAAWSEAEKAAKKHGGSKKDYFGACLKAENAKYTFVLVDLNEALVEAKMVLKAHEGPYDWYCDIEGWDMAKDGMLGGGVGRGKTAKEALCNFYCELKTEARTYRQMGTGKRVVLFV